MKKIKKIGVIDCDIGNIYSLENALIKLGGDYKISKNPKEFEKFDKIILLGVGSFPAVMDKLNKFGFVRLLNTHFKQGKYFLGICVGMQVLMTYGHEQIKTKGLNFIKGSVEQLIYSKDHPIPHIGWNEVLYEKNKKIEIFDEIKNRSSFYFVHSYHTKVEEKNVDMLMTEYGKNVFVSAIRKKNFYGVQFHPEKSQVGGMKVLENFIKL